MANPKHTIDLYKGRLTHSTSFVDNNAIVNTVTLVSSSQN